MSNSNAIEALVADLVPVRRLSPRDGLVVALGLMTVAVCVIALRYGFRADIVAGHPAPIVLLRSGALLLLGFAAALAATASARPAVGPSSNGWLWALGAALLFPASAAVLMIYEGTMPLEALPGPMPLYCLGLSLAASVVIGTGLTLWLRRGASVALERAGWLVGLAAGAFGTFAYSCHCSSDSLHFIGIWYSLAVAMAAGLGRLIVPHLIRW